MSLSDRVTRFEVFPLALPLKTPIHMARQTVSVSQHLVIRLTTADGVRGYGELTPTPSFYGQTLDSALLILRELVAPGLVGTPLDQLRPALAALDRKLAENPGIKVAVEMAGLDAIGRASGLPVSALLGGQRHATLPTVTIVAGDTPEETVEHARRAVRAGLRHLKVKFGTHPIDEDFAMLKAVREAAGPSVQLCVDANQGYTVLEAVSVARRLEAYDVTHFEQPVDAHDLEGMARVARATRVPITADEAVFNERDIVALYRAGAAGSISIKLAKAGGLDRGRACLHLARSLGMHAFLSGKVAESSIATAAQLHVGATLDELTEVSGTAQYLAHDVVREPLWPVDGAYAVPQGPGLGVEVDEAALERHALKLRP